MTEAQEIKGMLEVLGRQFADVKRIFLNSRPPLTRPQFAAATGLSYRTVCRKVWNGEIVEKDGRIPAKYLDNYLS